MARSLALAALVAAFVFVAPVAVHADDALQCGPTQEVIDTMKRKYVETPAVAAVVGTGTPVLIFANPTTKTFSVMTEQPGGTLCMQSSGQSWTYVNQPKDGVDL